MVAEPAWHLSVRWRRGAGSAGALVVFVVLVGCGAPAGPTPDTGAHHRVASSVSGPVPRPAHVVVVVFENKDEKQVIGNADAPYLTSLARRGAAFDNAHGVAHPSQPNYIALLSGSTQGVRDDSCPRRLGDRPNLARQLLDAGDSFAGYAEAMPARGFRGCSAVGGRYARKHNPWVDFGTIPTASNLPYSAFPDDLAKLPTVSFVIPDMCHDMHDCSVATGDRWARRHLARYVGWSRSHHSLLVVTFDEDSGTRANHIPTVLVGPMVRRGDHHRNIDHYTLLRTLEDMYGLPALGHASSAPPIAAWRG